MAESPDMNYDIDALFEHMVNNLGHEIANEQDWTFSFRGKDMSVLEEVAEELGDEFMVQLQDSVTQIDENGAESQGDPILMVVQREAFTASQVKAIAERMQSIATKRKLVYEGVSCYDPIDDAEIFGWLDPEDASWRLRHMTDCGLKENEELPWAFLVVTPTEAFAEQIASALTELGFDEIDVYEEPDDEGTYGLCVFVDGRNNESELAETCSKIDEIAKAHEGHLEGIQFFTRDELNDVSLDDFEEDL